MSVKTGLMYNPLTEKVYWGKMNTKTGVSVGNNQKDVTSDFIGTMLQKFPINTSQKITSNGKHECTIFVLDPKKSAMREHAPEMVKMLESILNSSKQDVSGGFLTYEESKGIKELLAKAKGE